MNIAHPIKKYILIMLLSFSYALSAAQMPNLKLNATQFMGSDGKKHFLKDYLGKGQWTTVIVWGPKCPACMAEMPEIQALYDDIKTSNINVLGLAIDYPSFSYAEIKQVQQFEEDYFISFPNLLISSNIYYDLGLGSLQGTPTIILVDPQGKVSALQTGGVPRNIIEEYVAKQQAKK